ncbi:MAG: hypothetical protein M1484_03945 [Patescibacteria group bacterium]|nr:hypothetical protein [Patescibacteria group bacterium]MCL5432213.1 hypothetical protein [Patescibacteria group bacterium]
MKRGFSSVIAVALVAALGVASLLFIFLVARSGPGTTQSQATPIVTDTLPPVAPITQATPAAQPIAPTPIPVASVAAGPSVTNNNIATVTNLTPDAFTVQTMLSTDRTTFVIDFSSQDWSGISTITYTLSYDTTSAASGRVISGTFTPSSVLSNRKTLTLGTCSQGVCTYDIYPHNFRLTVSGS